ncbi:putative DNA polymerase III delta prime subunit HolB [Arcobacter nitrofigilis DSM 7299]|uniref:Putative DNA polymerase III delta prime subunit HolB n=1 Tax=Arcobacter nitrofigilis (strain ATCC 33309 / DSM 7299 / CCUG 15893 / LMG 7604 / NCTC 12251 / CI) TaxID=572480 RepID=D5V1F1_ARCNC|nr:DNA polymerase III subunit delta' [Arcobacter nitrofigilis]ADG93385.1 putative DNA polymerase III delta prime subunit HolB [Arcobacter nitrofigilis DSM 7299]
MININSSSILIVNNIDETLSSLIPSLPQHSYRIIRNEEKDDFLTAQAQQVIKEAYISSNETKYIVLCGNSFRVEAQNSLLKVLEEPPRNIVFVIITTAKSNILPTILSRMPHKYLKSKIDRVDIDFDFLRMDLKSLYQYLKDNQKIGKKEAKAIIESVMLKINSQKIKLTQKELDVFSNGIKLLELNSRPINILTTLLLTIIHRKYR